MAMVMATIVILILTAIMDTRIDTILTGMVIVDHGVGPLIGDKTRGRPLPMGHNSSPLAKSSIWSSLNFSLVGNPLSDHPRIE